MCTDSHTLYFRVHFDRAEMFGQIAQAVMVEMVREMKIFADSGTAGIDLSRLQTNYQGQ